MQKKTVHTSREWKQIAGEIPIEANVLVDRGNDWHTVLRPSEVEHLERERKKFAPYIKTCKRKTRPGILLEIIRSDAPREVIQSALWLYRGYRSGFRTLVQMTESANNRLFELYPPSEIDPFYWDAGQATNIDALVEQFGWMRTDKSHEYLMMLATGKYHPLTQAHAICSMTWDKDRFDASFMLDLLGNPETPIRHIYEALYAIAGHTSRYPSKEFCDVVWPFVKHPDWHIYSEAIHAIRFKRTGRRMILDYIRENRASLDLRFLECVRDSCQGFQKAFDNI